ncbi:MAG: hypothetical protein ACI9C4_001092 [Paraglaciecola sp.]
MFANANINLLVVSAGTGYGVVWDKQQAKHTSMNMAEGGIGLGVKDYCTVIVFHTLDGIKRLINSGWTCGGNTDVALKANDKGLSFAGEAYHDNVAVYTAIKVIKFWVNDELN